MLIYNMFVRKQRENNNQGIIKHTLNVMDIKLKDDEIELVQSVNMRDIILEDDKKISLTQLCKNTKTVENQDTERI